MIIARSQREAHIDFTKTFSAEAIADWTKQVDNWCAEPLNPDLINPFGETVPDVTVADVRRELNAEEAADLANGTVHVHAISASNYLVTGLHLEDQQ